MIKGLVLYDYDGTLVDERDDIFEPTQITKHAIAQLQDLGYLCVLATGRALSYIPSGAKDLHLDGYVTSNGAYVTVHGKEIFNDVFADDELLELIQFMQNYHVNFVLEGTSYCYVYDMKEASYLHFMKYFKIPEDNYVRYQNFEQVQQKIGKITLAFPTKEAMQEGLVRLQGRYACSVHRNCLTFDIGKRTNHKGMGAEAIMNYYHIPKEHTYAFGDGDNDVELLASVEHGIAMRIHNALLDDVASYITGTVKEEGIYKALKKMEVL